MKQNQEYEEAADKYPRDMAIGRYGMAIDNAVIMIDKTEMLEDLPRLEGLLKKAREQETEAKVIAKQNWFTARLALMRFW